ncbi:hypothetical protein [Burkholderia diffusa]|uniref:hypothetical protein n=1 Tax=Burkholderia diffusa TaxID=488732 RepID=UPI0015830BB4|nr:hypothetical protein [Burkholderia diffusa]
MNPPCPDKQRHGDHDRVANEHRIVQRAVDERDEAQRARLLDPPRAMPVAQIVVPLLRGRAWPLRWQRQRARQIANQLHGGSVAHVRGVSADFIFAALRQHFEHTPSGRRGSG